ncbi:MAG: cyclic nucleotide-binding domain-containing protein [Ilumatobacter sp.]
MDTLLLNLAYISYIAASLLPTGLKLRVGLVVQSIVFVAWGAASGTWSAVWWNVLFGAVNVTQAIRIARRNSVQLSEREEQIRRRLFPELSRRDFLQLWSVGEHIEAATGHRLCTEGTLQDDLLLLTGGEVRVTNSAGLDRVRSATCFIGEMSFFSGDPASADVTSITDLEFHRWNQDDLRALRTLNSDCSRALQVALGQDVTRKLRSVTSAAAGSPAADDGELIGDAKLGGSEELEEDAE